MSTLAEIERLFNRGDYLGANKLADEYRVADCRNVCQNLSGVVEIAEAVEHSLAIITSLEDKINSYESEIRNLKGVAIQMEEREHAVEVQCKNLEDTCSLIDDLIKNLNISDQTEAILLEGNLNDEPPIEHIEQALNELDRVLSYKIDSSLIQMKCVRDQQRRATMIKSNFRERFYIEYGNYLDGSSNGLNSLEFLAALSRYISPQGRTNQFLLQIYGEITMKVKRNFDQYMERKLEAIRRFKQPKQTKCGVLSIVKDFEEFTNQMETLFERTGVRRPELDHWYPDMVTELFKIIETVEHKSTPTEMIRLENYKYLHDLLCSIKVPCLRLKRADAKQQYEKALNDYVTRYFGRPLEKINIFFDGVQAKIAQGVKEEEISFQLAFSKQELRRVLQMVTLKEVRKGLEEMYRHLAKHAFEPNSNLIEVIWHAMQTEFLSQYKAIQSMIERCYPSSNLSLTFEIKDVLKVFSDIAQSH